MTYGNNNKIKTTEEIQMTTTKRKPGRPKKSQVETTPEVCVSEVTTYPDKPVNLAMLSDITKLSKYEFIERHRCSEYTFLRLFHNATSNTEPEVKEVIKEVEIVRIEKVGMLDDLLYDVKSFYELGLKKYEEFIYSKQSECDTMTSDLLHYVELRELSATDMATVLDKLKEVRQMRRVVMDSIDFVFRYRAKLVDHLEFTKFVSERRERGENRKYTVRILQGICGEVL